MSRTKSLLKSLLLLAGGTAFFAGSHWTGAKIARAGLFSTARHSQSTAATVRTPERSRPGPAGHSQQIPDLKKKLTGLVGQSPMLFMDWEAKGEIRKILASLSAEELKDLHDSLHSPKDDFLMLMTEAAWARLDPVAAFKAPLARCETQSTPHGDFRVLTPVHEVFVEWAGNHPAEALVWLDSPELLPEIAGSKDYYYQSVLYDLMEKDFNLATKSALKMTPENGQGLLQRWGQSYSGDPALRDQLVDFAKNTGRPMDYAALNQGLLKTWPQEDSMGMMNYLIGMKDYLESGVIPAESRPAVDAAAVGAAIGREYDRPALEWWMDRYGTSSELPDSLAASFSQWWAKAPAKVDQWIAEQPPSPQLDALQGSLAPAMAAQGNFEQAVEHLDKVTDPALRQKIAAGVDHFWSRRDPDAAAAWRATVPELFPEGAK